MGDETVDGIQAKYISDLSTVMVATIQEAKDRISQIEYIFCSQLYPNFQSKSKTLEKVYSDSRLAAGDALRKRETTLLSQIEELKLENQQIKSANSELIKDKERLSEELDKTASLSFRLTSLEDYIDHLKKKLKKRSNEVEDARELHYRLVQLLQVKGSDELSKDAINMIFSEVKSIKVKADFLQEELSKKTLVTENLLKKVEHLSTETAERERKLSSLEEDNQKLTTRLQVFEENVGRLEELVRKKSDDLEEGRTALEVLQGKLNLTEREMLECKQKIVDHEKEKTIVVGKTKALKEELNGTYLAELEDLRCQSAEKSSALAKEINKREKANSAYKRLKSQYNFLCKKFGLTVDSVPHQDSLEYETKQIGKHEKPAISNFLEKKESETAVGADKVRFGTGSSGNTCEKESILKTVKTPATYISSIERSPFVKSSEPSATKSSQLSGIKRPASNWRGTRSRQSPGGHDPHDDFLDTPINENIKKVAMEEKHVPDVAKKDDSDEETQDMNPKPSPSRQRIQVVETNKKGFKHVESVRKKSERENLKGIECKQCKKFYDAVLPENDGNNNRNLRCEHHEGVSRHRYKYAPPMTPEGFWNIGFESEM